MYTTSEESSDGHKKMQQQPIVEHSSEASQESVHESQDKKANMKIKESQIKFSLESETLKELQATPSPQEQDKLLNISPPKPASKVPSLPGFLKSNTNVTDSPSEPETATGQTYSLFPEYKTGVSGDESYMRSSGTGADLIQFSQFEQPASSTQKSTYVPSIDIDRVQKGTTDDLTDVAKLLSQFTDQPRSTRDRTQKQEEIYPFAVFDTPSFDSVENDKQYGGMAANKEADTSYPSERHDSDSSDKLQTDDQLQFPGYLTLKEKKPESRHRLASMWSWKSIRSSSSSLASDSFASSRDSPHKARPSTQSNFLDKLKLKKKKEKKLMETEDQS